ncbi:RAS guanyl-releasing protein [Entamoeba marina]
MNPLPPRLFYSSNRKLKRNVLTESTMPCVVGKKKQSFIALTPEQFTSTIFPVNLKQVYTKISDNVEGKFKQKGLVIENRNVVSAPFEVLFEWAITPENTAFDFSKELILNYKSYCTSLELLSMLDKQCFEIEQIEGDDGQSSKKKWTKITIFMKNWSELLPEDFSNGQLSEKFDLFVKKYAPQFVGVSKIKTMVDTAKEVKILTVFEKLEITDKITKALPVSQMTSDFIVNQITLYEFELFGNIKINEFLGGGWTKKDKDVRCKNLCNFMDHFNAVTNWVSSSILNEPNKIARAELISKFIDVATTMYHNLNFTGFFEFYSGLNSVNISRLTSVWELVKDVDIRMKPLQNLADPTKSYSAYRNHVKQNITKAFIPFIGVIIQDLTFIEEGNPDLTEQGHVNFEKCRLMAKQLMVIKGLQQKNYRTRKPDDSFYNFIKTIEEHKNDDEKNLYELSLQIQPRLS